MTKLWARSSIIGVSIVIIIRLLAPEIDAFSGQWWAAMIALNAAFAANKI